MSNDPLVLKKLSKNKLLKKVNVKKKKVHLTYFLFFMRFSKSFFKWLKLIYL